MYQPVYGYLLIICLIYSLSAFSQVQEHFDDGDFINNPVWTGDSLSFIVNSDHQLQTLKVNASQTIALSTANYFLKNACWEFSLRLNFNPSSSNQLRIYLASSSASLKDPLDGYYVEIGQEGNGDSFDLYKQHGTSSERIIKGISGRAAHDTVRVRIKVICDAGSKWILLSDSTGGDHFVNEGFFINDHPGRSCFCGIWAKYTSSRSDKIFFDDFSIQVFQKDTLGPVILSASAENDSLLDLLFDEAVDTNGSSFMLEPFFEKPSRIQIDTLNKELIHLTFNRKFSEDIHYTLYVKGLHDLSGNEILPNSSISFYYRSAEGKLFINELFPDPFPEVGLPPYEFIELFNSSPDTLDLSGFSISDKNNSTVFKEGKIKPGEYIILCESIADSFFRPYGHCIGLNPFPSLNNSGDSIVLNDHSGNIISRVQYLDSWYKDSNKKQGGYSLERIDVKNRCEGSSVWAASMDSSGGTPGRKNSLSDLLHDEPARNMLGLKWINRKTVQVFFYTEMDAIYSALAAKIEVTENGINQQIDSLNFSGSILSIHFRDSLPYGNIYRISIDSLFSCYGNKIESFSSPFIYPSPVKKNELLLNEILFNPFPGGADFIELYNHSNSYIDLQALQIASRDQDAKLVQITSISSYQHILFPGKYILLTVDPNVIRQFYSSPDTSVFIPMKALPVFNDKSGTVVLLSDSFIVDEFSYNENMHSAWLENKQGVSLERVSFTKFTNDKSNWNSAAGSYGYATPGYKNSQSRIEPSDTKEMLTLLSKTFSPDNDGFEDYLDIYYEIEQAGSVGSLYIFDDGGRLVRRLVRNDLFAISGSYSWDGLNDDGILAPIGIYIIYLEVVQANGELKKAKKTCVLAQRLSSR